jgi:hypothetical protein
MPWRELRSVIDNRPLNDLSRWYPLLAGLVPTPRTYHWPGCPHGQTD